MMPFYQTGGFDYPVAMMLATLLGMGFGFVLERAGFARADVLVAQFHGTDMRVLKVMFTAIATTAVGIALLSGVGVMDVSKLVIPGTYLGPQIVGGLLLGAGFVISGYCPGTAVVAAGSGNLDGLYTIGGVMVGSLLFGFAYPLLDAFYQADGGLGKITFPDVLGVPWAVLALGVAVMAIGTFFLAEKLEKYYAKRAQIDPPSDSPKTRNRTLLSLGAVAAATLVTMAIPDPHVTNPPSRALASLDPIELATRIADGGDGMYLVDLRPAADCAKGSIPGAMCLPADDPDGAFLASLPPTRQLVLFGAKDVAAAPVSVSKYAGAVLKVAGGLEAFQAAVMEEPKPPTEATPESIAAFRLRAALHAHFTGATAPVSAPAPTIKPVTRAVKKGGGC
ncbi:MAG: hypothetical protein EP329_04090 [Deltaproteobacteria bacterium]|nr:MAG: hypothetical protein EP329_04090 [Deltaproteobacteria bacterium]